MPATPYATPELTPTLEPTPTPTPTQTCNVCFRMVCDAICPTNTPTPTPSPTESNVLCINEIDISGYYAIVEYSTTNGPCPGSHCCNAATFILYINGQVIGTAYLDNNSGENDQGGIPCGDRSTTMTVPQGVIKNEEDLFVFELKCFYDSCHDNIAWVKIIDTESNLVTSACIPPGETIAVESCIQNTPTPTST